MARPKNKNELINLSNKNFNIMLDLIKTFDEKEILQGKIPFKDRDKNIRDILAHLHHWHNMMLKWYEIGMSGEKPDMPSSGYSWRTVPDLNQKIWKKYQDVSYDEILKSLMESFAKLQYLIEKHSNSDLFEKKKYKWTGTTSLGAYLISATSSHYDWATKKIKKYRKMIK